MIKTSLLAAVAAIAFTAPTFAEAGDWLVRGRLISVTPDESATITPIGGDVSIDASIVPELDISYFFTDNIAAELILGVTPHDVSAVGTAAGDIDLGDVWLLPPTLNVQWHFNPDGDVRPYVGAGVNFTHFFNDSLPSGGIATSIDYDDSFGFGFQAGVDFQVNETWFANVDVKSIDIDTDVLINGAIAAEVSIDPVVFGVGFGRRF
jgi:outer membrane protein